MLNNQIQNYKILSLLGQGGMATVYLAHDSKFDTNVAIKLLNKEYTHNENIRKRFLAEAKSMFKMSHPNIIKVTDLIDEGETVAFVMEYVEGETLKEYIERKGKLSDDEIKSIFSQMLDAVGYVHEQNLVHRDIKPSNFMVSPKGIVKLMDFGIAKNTDASSAEYTQTGTGVQMGTPMYMSPEQITETKSVTPQSDIYSLGVVLWQMVTGEKPYDMKTLSTFQLQMKIVQEELPKTNTHWDSVIEKATEKEIRIRFNSCKIFKNYLNLDSKQEISMDKTVVNLDNSIIESVTNEMNKIIECPRCLGKGYVDWNDIYRLERHNYWIPGECALCEGKGEITENKKYQKDDVNLTSDNLSFNQNEKTSIHFADSFKEIDKKFIENKVLIDESYPYKVEEYLNQLFYEKGLDSFGKIMDNVTMVHSQEYDVFWTVEIIDASDMAIIYFKLENISFLIGSYNGQWRLVFNGQSYLDLKEIEHLNKLNLSIQSKAIELLILMINKFKISSLYLGLKQFQKYISLESCDFILNHTTSQKISEANLEEKMLEEIEKLSVAFSELSSKSYYLQEIPDKKMNNFWIKFKDFIPDSNTSFYWYYDDTLFGKGDDGFAIVKTSGNQWLLLIADFVDSVVSIIELVSSSELFSGEFKNFYKLHSINGDAQKSRFDEVGAPFNKFLTLLVVDKENEIKRIDFTGFTDREKINALCDFWVAMEWDPL